MNTCTITALRYARSIALATVLAVCANACGTIANMTRTITPNEHSARVGPEQVKADEEECRQFGSAETRRLLDELLQGDPSVAANEARESRAGDTARTLTKLEGGTSAEGAVAAGVAGFLFSSWDPDTYDESHLAKYLGIEGGLGDGFIASQRLKHTCLRARGYQVDEYAEDGAGTAHLVWAPPSGITRIVLREADGTERVFHEYVTPSKR